MRLKNIYGIIFHVAKCDNKWYCMNVTETQEKWLGEASRLRVMQLRQARFTVKEISVMFGVSARTIHRALNGQKEGGDGDQTIIPPSSTEADDLNNGESTAMTTGEPK